MNNSGNKVVVITGASSGIGQAIALHLANKPFSLVLVARRLDRINALVDQIIQQGGQAIARSVLFAIEQPGNVDINEIVVRPTQEEF
ncbi:TPA: SDR family NAD(P)-dependent oxidoreductase [Enterobacter chengduensis]|uniref:SDR family NAD(P)-dependent oxidoreductase n=1 Tax=Enterobacter chengduensis TaxID=2494701 RepID=A0AAW3HHM7_9ENTR|nr:SDR family NAD(P)-dependent oxidoreductase [Enterobacter chengduensis]KDF50070.1 hypothetical protein AE07_00319 [Enterobacter cloacae BWH 43]GJL40379.1 hypothetical protein TUM17577_15880 [Enterobacter asburiae]KJX36429.1 hypothetical protein SG71_10470 [Enterobacter chengduensis]MCK1098034.1 SDR family NAD(P)-dependent oxidoreductase [Enterobacter chengduensis]MCK6820496.1 SDR family NAD(P)-dependent oxidoreductase [Enterobacter chengduensis]